MLPKIEDFFRGKNILILGFGREGQSTYHLIRKLFPEMPLTIADCREITLQDENVKLICGENYLDCVNDFEIVMKSPGISFRDVEVKDGVLVTCQTDLFLQYAPCHKIGITGSKGKTTTSTLCYEMLTAAGKDARLIGNIGVPVLEELDNVTEETVAVIEMSSHQLEFTRHSPEVAILTNIYEEHLEHYKGGFTGYVHAKLNIVRHQTAEDTFIYNATQGIKEHFDLDSVPSSKIGVQLTDAIPFNAKNPHLLGEHNRQDILFAFAATQKFGVTAKDAEKAVQNHKAIEHRMELVGTFKDIIFYNDCIATIPHSVACAVKALEKVDTLIFGGKDRGIDYSEFEQYLKDSQIQNLIGTPDTGFKICDAIGNVQGKRIYKAKDLEDAVKFAYAHTEKGKVCLLSPAASSYNVYKNFEEKGRHYKALVRTYGESKD